MNMVETYFDAERTAGLLFIIIGLLAVGISIYGWHVSPFWRSATWLLAITALIQISIGFSVWSQSPKDKLRVEQMISHDHALIISEEIPRMQKVMTDFVRNRRFEIMLIIAGLALVVLANRGSVCQGMAAALVVQVYIVLLVDHFGEQRALRYLEWLKTML